MSHAADRPLSVRVSPVQRAPAQVRSSARCERRHHQHPPASAGMPEWLFDLLRRIAAKRTVFNILSRSRLCSTPARIRMSASDRRRVDRPTRCVAPGDLVPGPGDRLGGPGLAGDRSVRSAVRQRPHGSNQLAPNALIDIATSPAPAAAAAHCPNMLRTPLLLRARRGSLIFAVMSNLFNGRDEENGQDGATGRFQYWANALPS